MEKVSARSAKKMGLAALTLVTASNMMGSGVFMLPTNLATHLNSAIKPLEDKGFAASAC